MFEFRVAASMQYPGYRLPKKPLSATWLKEADGIIIEADGIILLRV
jgi:hypothetical protein